MLIQPKNLSEECFPKNSKLIRDVVVFEIQIKQDDPIYVTDISKIAENKLYVMYDSSEDKLSIRYPCTVEIQQCNNFLNISWFYQ